VTDRRRLFAVLYYGGLALVLALILLQLLDEVLGARLASHIAHNSEAYLAALVLSAWIQFVRPRLTGRRAEWPIAVLVGVLNNRVRQDVDMVTLRVNYRFGGPVVAKY